jgi:hypothetical protein
MDPPQGIATFPGIGQLVEASISMTHGISPSMAVLTIAPQTDFDTEVGTLTFTMDDTTIEFPDCKVDYSSLERNEHGEIWRLSMFDRRWRWRFGQISGTYNVWRDDFSLQRGENGTIDTERTPQQLAALCLEAMGESDYDVADLPDDPRPSVEWDYELPAEALATLCDQLACRVVLQLDNRVAIRRVGVGATLNDGDSLEHSLTVDPPERPDAIAVVCGNNRYQVDFQLEAVGLEEGDPQSADTVRPLEQLSYKPSGGWSRADVPYFHQVDVQFRDLAQKSVFRYYRIKVPLEVGGYDGPDGNRVTRLEQLLPIEDEQVVLADEDSQPANLPAALFGVWYPETGGVINSVLSLSPPPEPVQSDGGTSLSSVYQRPHTIDTARGLVIFDEPVYRNTHVCATGGPGHEVVIGAAQLVLRAACSVRDPETLAPTRYVRQRSTGGQFGTASRYLKHEEMVLTHTPTYSESYALDSVSTNATDVDRAADFYLDAAEQEYQTVVPQTARYPGLAPIELDGAIQRISFRVGGAGTMTTVARHNEQSRVNLPHKERRRIEGQRDVEHIKKKLSTRNLARAWKASPITQLRFRS